MRGFLLVDKAEGVTSHDVVSAVRRKFGIRRVGHAGTLDPVCSGLLVLAVGPATRLLRFLALEPKEYVGTMRLGETTDTQDAEGEVVERHDVTGLTLEGIRSAAEAFLGETLQVPPMYSAVKIKGKKLYEYARKGEEVPREPRPIKVYRFDILSYDPPDAEFRVQCSGGTYVRTLAHDLGQRLGVGAHLCRLRRTACGEFNVEDARPVEDLTEADLIPPEEALDPMPVIRLPRPVAQLVQNGNLVRAPVMAPTEFVGFLGPNGELIAVAEETPDGWKPVVVLPPESSTTRKR
ncbi:MAG: tRNA pseudouridine(55) synthase TruB [Armatimonadetes bacterium]|nr:MAG: tRNA pseudouridine(55) synthase TruB [Armatimonadota bacterium]